MIDISQVAEKGLKKLEDGKIGIKIDAKNESDAKYLKNYFRPKGYDVKIEDTESKKDQGTVYPVSVFNQISVEVKQNA